MFQCRLPLWRLRPFAETLIKPYRAVVDQLQDEQDGYGEENPWEAGLLLSLPMSSFLVAEFGPASVLAIPSTP